jgi:hypothetical protein
MIEDTAEYPGKVEKVSFGSATRRLRVQVIRDLLWYTGAKTEPVSLVLVRDVAGQWRDEALLAFRHVLIPRLADQNRYAQSRIPMNIMRQG